jgi:uncharacterized protein (DUF433 family)
MPHSRGAGKVKPEIREFNDERPQNPERGGAASLRSRGRVTLLYQRRVGWPNRAMHDIIFNMSVQTTQTHVAAGGQIVSNPAILGGRPVFAGTRVPAETLFDYLADGLSLDYFLESFPSVSREQAITVLRYGLYQINHELAA